MEGDYEGLGGLMIRLISGSVIYMALQVLLIIVTCLLVIAIIVGIACCVMRSRSEDQKENQVVPISIVETY